MTEILPVIQLGNAILRQSATAIDSVHDPAIATLIENLMATLQQSNGVGIAAPQVAVSKRLFIVASRPNPRYPNAPEMQPTPMINPRLVSHSDEMGKDWEGCLSVPGIRGLIPRYQSIEVEYLNPNGQLQTQELTDFVARIFQHELDHLDGLVFLDRLESVQEIITDQEYLKLIQP
ncbi:MAG: peptide deformylase [Leptolyngbyaceae cyanobacterium SM1_3_5]|nr:peptide deformylase [Leptolyngbyaceae cyanobacterium SM1_3_5]